MDRVTSVLKTNAVSIAIPQHIPHTQGRDIPISSIGICAGSGGSMLNGLDVDLLFTGELSHHEALAAIEQGKCVITTFHSNTERGFLAQRMAKDLERSIDEQSKEVTGSVLDDVQVMVSKTDRDPYKIAVVGQEGW
jgi:putative NIF3 family GTP cyclohydrolase 1 type 2